MLSPVYLIVLSDFTPYKAITDNVDKVKDLQPYILEAQKFDIRAPLGQPLYDDIIRDKAASPSLVKYKELLEGKSYVDPNDSDNTIEYEGLKSAIVYYAYARYVEGTNIKSTPFGLVKKSHEHSEHISDKQRGKMADQARSGGLAQLQQVFQFLDDFSDDFPLWTCRHKSRKRRPTRTQVVKKKTGFPTDGTPVNRNDIC